jgi:F-type H+-transporting ATPase subunit epsilon
MNNKLSLKIITPDLIFQKYVKTVNVKTVNGYVGIYFLHIPFVAILKISKMMYQENEKKEYLNIQGGLILTDGKKVSIITDSYEEIKS